MANLDVPVMLAQLVPLVVSLGLLIDRSVSLDVFLKCHAPDSVCT